MNITNSHSNIILRPKEISPLGGWDRLTNINLYY